MLRSDRTLIGIVLGLLALVVVAFVVVLRQPTQAYLGADTPEGAANDYVLALARGDYAKAYGLLADDLPRRPSNEEEFVRDIDEDPWRFGTSTGSASLRVLGAELDAGEDGGEIATVRLERTVFTDRGLMDTGEYTESSRLRLRRSADGLWRITGGDRFVHPCWLGASNCFRDRVAPAPVEVAP